MPLTKLRVLCPNGRRQIVNIDANTSILWIRETVCKKQGFDPNIHQLKFHKRWLNDSSNVRFENLPNNAELELLKSENQFSVDSKVTVLLQKEDGARLSMEFDPHDNLLDLLERFEVPECATGALPMCRYLMKNVIGKNDLRATSLRQLGLTSGKACIRYTEVPEEGIQGQAHIVVSPTTEQKSQQTVPFIQSDKETHGPSQISTSINKSNPSSDEAMSKSVRSIVASGDVETPMEIDDDSHAPDFETVCNISKEEADKVSDSIIISNEKTSEVQTDETSDKHEKCKSIDDKNLTRDSPTLESTSSSLVSEKPSKVQADETSDKDEKFKIVDDKNVNRNSSTLESSSSMVSEMHSSNYSEDLAKAIRMSLEEEHDKPIEYLDENGSIVLNPESQTEEWNLSDEFFDVTVEDIRLMHQRLRENLENESTLMLRSDSKPLNRRKYEFCCVRIRMPPPDYFILQSNFLPSDTIGDVMAFVRLYLVDPQIEFFLYTTPPKVELQFSRTLDECGLLPMCLLHLGVGYSIEGLLLKDQVRRKAVSLYAYKKTFRKQNEASGNKAVVEDAPEEAQTSKVPKWFKLGRK